MKFIFRFKNKRFEITFDDSLFLLGVIWFPMSENNLSDGTEVALKHKYLFANIASKAPNRSDLNEI